MTSKKTLGLIVGVLLVVSLAVELEPFLTANGGGLGLGVVSPGSSPGRREAVAAPLAGTVFMLGRSQTSFPVANLAAADNLTTVSPTIVVLDSIGRGLEGAGLTLRAPDGSVIPLTTGPSGLVSLPGVAAGNYSVQQVVWEGVDVTPVGDNVLVLGSSDLVHVQARVYVFTVMVKDAAGLAVDGATVSARHQGGKVFSATTDANGQAMVVDLPVGAYTVTASFFLQSSTVTGSAADLSRDVIQLKLAAGTIILSELMVVAIIVLSIIVYLYRKRRARRRKS